jgi:hypothetical protein
MKIAQLLLMWAAALGNADVPWHDRAQDLPLQSLTVPAKVLTQDCRLQPDPVGGRVRQAFASNPWIGDDRRAVVMIKTAMGAVMTRLPDGPPLDRRQAADFERRSIEGVNHGYRAAYENSDGVDVEVLALDFDTAARAAGLQLTSPREAAKQTTRFVRGSTVIVIKARAAHSDCFEHVRAYIASLK